MDKNEPVAPPASIHEAQREFGRQVKPGFAEGLASADAERAATAAPRPEAHLTAEEQARLERLLRAWPGPTGTDRPA